MNLAVDKTGGCPPVSWAGLRGLQLAANSQHLPCAVISFSKNNGKHPKVQILVTHPLLLFRCFFGVGKVVGVLPALFLNGH